MTSKPFIVLGIENSCDVEVPEHLLDAWSEPYSILVTACAVVVAVASHPLAVGIVKLALSNLQKKIQLWRLQGQAEEGGEEGGTTTVNPVHDGGGKKIGIALQDKPIRKGLGKIAKEEAMGKLEDIETGAIETINSTIEDIAGDQTSKKKFKEPDHASAVFYNFVSLVMAMTAFMQYWVSNEVNFMDINLFSSNQSVECR